MPNFAIAGAFLITWNQPVTYGPGAADALRWLMLLEGLVIHTSVILLAAFASKKPRPLQVAGVLAVMLAYTGGVLYIARTTGPIWPLIAFWGLTFPKLIGFSVDSRPHALRHRWIAMFLGWFVILNLASILQGSIPLLGLGGAARGQWLEEAASNFAFGVAYFTAVGVYEIVVHTAGRQAQSANAV